MLEKQMSYKSPTKPPRGEAFAALFNFSFLQELRSASVLLFYLYS